MHRTAIVRRGRSALRIATAFAITILILGVFSLIAPLPLREIALTDVTRALTRVGERLTSGGSLLVPLAGGGGLIATGVLLHIVLRLRRARSAVVLPSTSSSLLPYEPRGVIALNRASLAALVGHAVDDDDENRARAVSAKVSLRRKPLAWSVRVAVKVPEEIALPETTDMLRRRIDRVLAHTTGIGLGKLRILVSFEPRRVT